MKDLKFLQCGPLMNELAILNTINNSPKMSQSEISREVNLAPSMVNNYIKRLVEQGFVKKQNVTNRDMQYNITGEGDKRRLYLLISYMSEVIDLYKLSKSEFEKRLRSILDSGIRRVVFYGAGETGEVAIHAVRNFGIDLLGVVDDNPDLWGKDFYGYRVCSFEEIEQLVPDAVVITSYAYQDEICKKLEDHIRKGLKVLKL